MPPPSSTAQHPLELSGVMPALVTPMRDDGSLDLPALERLVDRQLEAGVSGLVPCGTTGETPTLSQDEWLRVIETVTTRAGGKVPVIAGAGANSTKKACALTKAAADVGVQATLQVTPYYSKPTQDGLYRHFVEVAEASELPVILYNIPSRSAVGLTAETIRGLAEHPRIVAIKEATGDVGFASRIMELTTSLRVLSGDDALALPLLALGASGVISVASNVAPAEMVSLVAAALAGDYAEARRQHHRLYPLFRTLFLETNPIPVKAAMEIRGYETSHVRLPLTHAHETTRVALRRVLEDLGLLP